MSPKLVIDESVDFRIINALDGQEWEVLSILKQFSGIKDKQVLDITLTNQAILITEDKDFGEWVFAHKVKVGVIFLRYHPDNIDKIITSLVEVLRKYGQKLKKKFVVIRPGKMRIRDI